jgi:hypothetical protein
MAGIVMLGSEIVGMPPRVELQGVQSEVEPKTSPPQAQVAPPEPPAMPRVIVPLSALYLHALCDRESLRYALGGVLIETSADGAPANLVATDGRQLCHVECGECFDCGRLVHSHGFFKTILPADAMVEFLRMCKGKNLSYWDEAGPAVEISCLSPQEHGSSVELRLRTAYKRDKAIRFGETGLTCGSIVGRFPRWREVVEPKGWTEGNYPYWGLELLGRLLTTMAKVVGNDSDRCEIRLPSEAVASQMMKIEAKRNRGVGYNELVARGYIMGLERPS